jgi:hypothetical protein
MMLDIIRSIKSADYDILCFIEHKLIEYCV